MRVALYPRVSGHEQEDNYSIPEQIDRMKKYCAARDWMVYKIYTDSGFSGSNLERPGLQALIKDAENKKIDMVLVYKLDRLSRSQRDTLYLIEDVFDKHGVYFSSMTENFDTSTPFGKAILGILAVFAQLEREQIKERTMVGKESRAKEGKWHGSRYLPTGYDYVDGELVINEYEAMQIREAAELFVNMTPVRTIARMFNAKGYLRKGRDWDAKNVKMALTNPAIIGKLRYRDKVYEGRHKPIIDEETFNKIVEIDNKRREEWAPRKAAGQKSLLGGIIYCKRCGARYARTTNSKGSNYYACYSRSKQVARMVKDPNCQNKYFREADLDGIVINEIKKLAIDDTHLQRLKDNKPINEAADKVKLLRAEVDKIDGQINKMMDLYALGSIDLDFINKKVSDLNATKTSLNKEIESLNGATDNDDKLTPDEVKGLALAFGDDATLEQKRAIVQSLIYYIEIDGDNVYIHWKF